MKNHMSSDASTLEAEARKAGFNNAAEMRAFYENRARMRKRGGSAIPQSTPAPTPSKPPPKKKSGNPLQRLLEAFGN